MLLKTKPIRPCPDPKISLYTHVLYCRGDPASCVCADVTTRGQCVSAQPPHGDSYCNTSSTAWDFGHLSIPWITTVARHFAADPLPTHTSWEFCPNSSWGQRLCKCSVFLTHLEPPPPPTPYPLPPPHHHHPFDDETLSEIAFAWLSWLMMFLGRAGPPSAESRARNRGGLIDRLRSWKLQTKGLYGNVCRIKILHSLQSLSQQSEYQGEKRGAWKCRLEDPTLGLCRNTRSVSVCCSGRSLIKDSFCNSSQHASPVCVPNRPLVLKGQRWKKKKKKETNSWFD